MCDTACDAFKALKAQYEGKTATDLGTILNSVTRMTFDDRTTTIEDHISDYDKRWGFMKSTIGAMMTNETNKANKFHSGISDLSQSDEAKAEFLLLTLPPFYAGLVSGARQCLTKGL